MFSKSRGQVLRLATVLHMLFSIDKSEESLSVEVSEAALKAAVDLIKLACQQTAYMAGRESLSEEMERFRTGKLNFHAPLMPSCMAVSKTRTGLGLDWGWTGGLLICWC